MTTILLVDDEDLLREGVREILEFSDFTVIEARDGMEALELFAVNNVDLVISDIVMPNMDGPTMARNLRGQFGDIRLLFMSGYADDGLAEDQARVPNSVFLPKPFSVRQLSELAAELGVVIPVSIYEKDGPLYFNSVVMIDADGAPLGVYRKSHIPDGPGYTEKYYFSPGDTGFEVWETKFATIGVGICWDQWFPEAARCMALMGAEALLYPTAIGWLK